MYLDVCELKTKPRAYSRRAVARCGRYRRFDKPGSTRRCERSRTTSFYGVPYETSAAPEEESDSARIEDKGELTFWYFVKRLQAVHPRNSLRFDRQRRRCQRTCLVTPKILGVREYLRPTKAKEFDQNPQTCQAGQTSARQPNYRCCINRPKSESSTTVPLLWI